MTTTQAFLQAVINGDINEAKRLSIMEDCNVNARDGNSESALYIAIKQRNIDMMSMLLAINELDYTQGKIYHSWLSGDTHETPLMLAARSLSLPILQPVVQRFDRLPVFSPEIFFEISLKANTEFTIYLIDNLNIDFNYVFHRVISNAHHRLQTHGSNIPPDGIECTPLLYKLVEFSRIETVMYLLRKENISINVNCEQSCHDRVAGDTTTSLLYLATERGYTELVNQLLIRNIDVNKGLYEKGGWIFPGFISNTGGQLTPLDIANNQDIINALTQFNAQRTQSNQQPRVKLCNIM